MVSVEMVLNPQGQGNGTDELIGRMIRHFHSFRQPMPADSLDAHKSPPPELPRDDASTVRSNEDSVRRERDGSGATTGDQESLKRGSTSEGSRVLSDGDGKGKFECKLCSKRFSVKPNLRRHHATVHLKQKPYACTRCDKTFGHKNVLDNHIRCVHKRIRPFSCDLCGKSFGFKVVLKSHVKAIHKVDFKSIENGGN
uniref:C2H2-type domain-containing protein n=1 Tax=Rhodosorus marinus TaxID=101924 RepID=A0A7S0G2B9_9RHOD|mmetsp:Transcript_18650/g.27001  ORF Transcript_18650/g.27001 Transcript_18650/m.27001 type:complete len:197 (+) Transcript_18650:429-1019(+)|eukprot:CAMPEP_0184748726 /NCGR_PEP_ID=MMETSP0315-20130426/22177_1 /TAXON_ID=101924 /ORGANISM="Rhodosorus marinus, Strain UTEX LB 2760" /LENGTH=196 /DNA_ID=CAMNT_0027224545 /DNA_START=227 /DNA_END=817 /DNA_ORIENTATION=+